LISVAAVYDRRSKKINATVADRRYNLRMNLEEFREYCLKKPDATEGTPFGETVLVFKVGGKMFALASLDQVPTTANLKCDPDLALELRDRYEQVRPGYHMNKKHWNTVELESGIPDAELRKMADHSYDLVVKRLPNIKRTRNKDGSASALRAVGSRELAAKTMLTEAAKPRRNSNALRGARST
jgi:predicted DNA-binding protein (MmcQ/YjbR family)